jgi:dTDP-4-dehydrorhamnose 3,5-epimerase
LESESTILNLLLLDLSEHHDKRGVLTEIFRKSWLAEVEYWADFKVLQQNFVRSNFGAIRGIHMSKPHIIQRKILFCINGKIRDQLVDLRPNSPTYLQTLQITLSESTPALLFVPHGVGHSFQVESDTAEIVYMFDSEYDPKSEISITPFDSEIDFKWELPYTLSEKDKRALTWEQIKESLENNATQRP